MVKLRCTHPTSGLGVVMRPVHKVGRLKENSERVEEQLKAREMECVCGREVKYRQRRGECGKKKRKNKMKGESPEKKVKKRIN